MAGFGDSVKLNSQKLLEKTNSQCLAIARELFVSIVALSPSPTNPGAWAEGLLVNQWYPAINEFSSDVGTSTSPYGVESMSRIDRTLGDSTEFLKKDGMVTLSNNLPYAGLAENLGWQPPNWSGKVGPYLMVAKSLQAVAARYR